MYLKLRTKLMFAKELEQMLKTTPMEKIRVTNLCKNCGTITPTFYYHFQDKYELAAWIFLYDFTSVYGDKPPEFSVERIYLSLKKMEERKDFYKKAYTDKSQNSIKFYIHQFNVEAAVNAVEYTTGQPVTPAQLRDIKFRSYGMAGTFEEWLFDMDPIPVHEFAAFQYEHTPEFLKKAFKNFPFSTARYLD